jgi:hypothetical protein
MGDGIVASRHADHWRAAAPVDVDLEYSAQSFPGRHASDVKVTARVMQAIPLRPVVSVPCNFAAKELLPLPRQAMLLSVAP